MTPNSRDLVNPRASVTIEAIDRSGNVVDRHVDYGRHEPSVQLLDFMLNCEAMFGKLGDKIVRFTCEIAYVLLVGLIFLSSNAARANVDATIRARDTAASADFTHGDVLWASPDLRHIRVLHATPKGSPFTQQNAPIRYVVRWPTPDELEAKTLVPKAEPKWRVDWHKVSRVFFVIAAGSLALLFFLGFRHWWSTK